LPSALKRCSKTTNVMVLAAMAGIARLSGTRTLPGLSPRLRSRTLYRSIRRHTIYTGCLTTASRWGRLLWPLLAGRMRLYRMGLSLLCGCSRWLLTSRNTVSKARWMATSGSSPSSRSNEWRPLHLTVNQTDLGGFEVGGNPQWTVRGGGSRPPSAARAVAESGATMTPTHGAGVSQFARLLFRSYGLSYLQRLSGGSIANATQAGQRRPVRLRVMDVSRG